MVQAGHSYARTWEEEIYRPTSGETNYQTRVRRTYKRVNVAKSFILKTCLFVFAYALLMVYLCAKSSVLGYDIVDLQNKISAFDKSNHRMEYQIAQLTSLNRIERIATKDLGMHRSINSSVICMEAPKTNDAVIKASAVKPAQAKNRTLKNIYKNLRLLANNN